MLTNKKINTALISFGSVISALRVERSLTQQQLADISGLSKTSIQRIEKGKLNLTAASMLKISTALNITMAHLWLITSKTTR